MKKGFTLAEVLLTLAIIGVVAALTIPAVITKVTQDQYVVALKKAYNTLKSVEREAVQEHGDMENWTLAGNTTDFDTYFKPYFDILKDCGTGTDDGCFTNKYTKFENNDTLIDTINSSTHARIITSDGISFAYLPLATSGRIGSFRVDVNGKKPPNKGSRDLFLFEVHDTKGIKPDGYSTSSANINSNCKAGGNGYYCTTKVLSEGAMNY